MDHVLCRSQTPRKGEEWPPGENNAALRVSVRRRSVPGLGLLTWCGKRNIFARARGKRYWVLSQVSGLDFGVRPHPVQQGSIIFPCPDYQYSIFDFSGPGQYQDSISKYCPDYQYSIFVLWVPGQYKNQDSIQHQYLYPGLTKTVLSY